MAFVMISDVVDVPAGGVSPLAWVIISALAAALGAVCTVSLKWITRLYNDLKRCNAEKAAEPEEILALLRVARIQMERSKPGGR